MKNKRGWLRILEAAVAVLLIISITLVLFSNEGQDPRQEEGENIYALEELLLNIISKDNNARELILAYDLTLDAEDRDEIKGNNDYVLINNILNDRIPQSLGYEFAICGLEEVCGISEIPGRDEDADNPRVLYVFDRIISSSLNSGVDPRRIIIYMWPEG